MPVLVTAVNNCFFPDFVVHSFTSILHNKSLDPSDMIAIVKACSKAVNKMIKLAFISLGECNTNLSGSMLYRYLE